LGRQKPASARWGRAVSWCGWRGCVEEVLAPLKAVVGEQMSLVGSCREPESCKWASKEGRFCLSFQTISCSAKQCDFLRVCLSLEVFANVSVDICEHCCRSEHNVKKLVGPAPSNLKF
jgi:hypothetical protein